MEDLALTEDRSAFAAAARRTMQTCPRDDPAAAARHLAETGPLGMLAEESAGGLGLGMADALAVVEAAGAALLAFPLVETMLAAAAIDLACATELVAGEAIATIAWRGTLMAEENSDGDWEVSGTVGRVPMADAAQWLLVPITRSGQATVAGIALVELAGALPTVTTESEFDLERPVSILTIDVPAPAKVQLDNGGAWARIAAQGALLRGADMLGAAEASFAEAAAHVGTRRQFGRLLVANQALRHMLARDHLALVGLRHSLAHAANAADAAAPEAETARLVACAVAAEACPRAAENAIQLHGGMGFAWDLKLHRRLRRIRAGTALLDAVTARAALADLVLG
jgi:alkylation response protein AidB-like acyl-CoA dehydrogenase